MLRCNGCGQHKVEIDFYACNRARCKECVKASVAARRIERADEIRAYDRARGTLPHRKEAVRQRAHKYTGRYKSSREADPDKRSANIAVGNAIRDGRLVPEPCERCGHVINVQAHHEDYSKPLDVIWLCPPCHGARHREINEVRRQRIA